MCWFHFQESKPRVSISNFSPSNYQNKEMLSSTNYLNSFPQLHSPSSFHLPFVGTGAAAGYFPVNHPLLGYLVPPDAPVFHDQALINNMTVSEKKPEDDVVKAKKPSRKDRHSKICTSQGLRDRRVRLSIGISRRFFHLQDMLGFDKASETLEWLLDKSKNDINRLSKSVLTSNSDSEITDVVADDQDGDPAASASKDYKKMKKLAKKDAFARECRAKARERARERTREKQCTFNTTTTTTTLMVKEPTKGPESGQHIVQQSFVINKLMMPPFERSSKGLEDWDISSATTRSSQCYMNPSTELQMYGKP